MAATVPAHREEVGKLDKDDKAREGVESHCI